MRSLPKSAYKSMTSDISTSGISTSGISTSGIFVSEKTSVRFLFKILDPLFIYFEKQQQQKQQQKIIINSYAEVPKCICLKVC